VHDERGFVVDPEADEDWRGALNPDLRTFSEIDSFQCLVLLGEPGIGKTVALESERAAVQARGGPDEIVLQFNLRFAESLSALDQVLFLSDGFESWKQSRQHLHLFLDSLDEGLLEVASLASFLDERFRGLDVARLSLRIACRTADWFESFEEKLVALFGDEQIGVYELVQLRQRDVEAAAHAHSLDSQAFVEQLEASQAVPLALKPVTLEFLLRKFARTGSLPASVSELYRDGLLALCEEPDEERRRRAPALSGTQRLAIAERLAALTVYAGRDEFWIGAAADAPSSAVPLAEASGGQESTGADIAGQSSDIDVDEEAVREVLSTGLFTMRGTNRLGWSHQTYAEFLAARYVARRFEGRTVALLRQSADRDRVPPQLYSAAAWLATLVPEVRSFLLEREPDVLLRGDLTHADEHERAALVSQLLKLSADDALVDFSRTSLAKLDHAGLADQLRPVLLDSHRSIEERALAVDITELCGLKQLQADLVEIALSNAEPYRLRIDAAYTIAELGDDVARGRLRALLDEATDDPNDDLRGAALIALWPRGLNASELVAALAPPKNRNYFGIYTMFLSRQTFEGVAASDLAVLLAWAADQPVVARRGQFDDFIDKLVAAGLARIDEPEIAPAAARVVATLLARDHALTAGGPKKATATALESRGLRRRLVELLVPHVVAGDLQTFDIAFDAPLVSDDDLPWLIEELKAAPEAEQQVWAELIERIFAPARTAHLEVVLEARERHATLRELLAPLLDPIHIDSDRARALRDGYERHKSRIAKRQKHRDCEDRARPTVDVEALLALFDAGDLDAWWRLSAQLVIEAADEHNEFRSDVSASPTWQKASDELHTRLLQGSLDYLHKMTIDPDQWFGKDIFNRPAAAGYRSLRLLAEHAPARLAEVEPTIWARWGPIIVAYPSYGGPEGTAQRELVARAYEQSPAAIRGWFIRMIKIEDAKDHEPFVLRRFEDVWDDDLEVELAKLVTEGSLSARGVGAVIAFMLDHGSSRAEQLARSMLPVPPPLHERRQIALQVALLLVARVEESFEMVWSAVEADEAFGRDVVAGLAGRDEERGSALGHLNDNRLARVFAWTTRQFPHADDPDRFESGFVGEREMISRWRDGLLSTLETRGTQSACRALRQLAEAFPELPWLRRVIARAERRALAEAWVRPTPSELLTLAAQPEQRFVANGDQLLEVLAESLERAHAKLTGETPQAPLLWNVLPGGAARPKDEGDLSDWLKVHLQEDLAGRRIVVNREVEIRRAPGPGIGQRTDIHVDAVAKNAGVERIIRAVIEVKGCWNRELKSAIETQLADSYLTGAGNQFGLYVVGWFSSDRWDESDTTRALCSARSRKEVDAELVDRARKISNERGLDIRVYSLDIPLNRAKKTNSAPRGPR
jgi:hypothetical protein